MDVPFVVDSPLVVRASLGGDETPSLPRVSSTDSLASALPLLVGGLIPPPYLPSRVLLAPEAEPIPTRFRILCDGFLTSDDRGIITKDRKTPMTELNKNNTFCMHETGIDDGILIRNLKTGLFLGCVTKSGLDVVESFPYSIDRARELVWKHEGSLLKNVYHNRYIGHTNKEERPHIQGLIEMEDEPEKALRTTFSPVQLFWSFKTSQKLLLTVVQDSNLVLQESGLIAGLFSWAPFFELVRLDSHKKTFYLRTAKLPANGKQWVRIAGNGDKLEMSSADPSPWRLQKTKKTNFFHLYSRGADEKRLYVSYSQSKGQIVVREALDKALAFELADAKGITHKNLLGPEVTKPASPAWGELLSALWSLSKHPISKPIFVNCPKVLERAMSSFSSIFFVAQQNEPEVVRTLIKEELLNGMERILVNNARTAASMAVALTFKETKLFQALDTEIQIAKQNVGAAEKLFAKHATQLPHVVEFEFQPEDPTIRVCLLSDFGSGSDKVRAMLDAVFGNADARPDIFIHLGDIYKRGSKREQLENFIEPVQEAIQKNEGSPASVFAVPGNHDYMARGGEGYYWALKEMEHRGLSEQDASFFCINVGDRFSILGLDTSLEGLKYDSDALYTRLNEEQVVWLASRMGEIRAAERKAILLLHHPIISCGVKYPLAAPTHVDGVNMFLWKQLSPYFDVVCAVYWGHEHSFRIYEPFTMPETLFIAEQKTLQRGRLIGHGSKYKPPKTTQFPAVAGVRHPLGRGIGCVILDFSESTQLCEARYCELSNETNKLEENFRETF